MKLILPFKMNHGCSKFLTTKLNKSLSIDSKKNHDRQHLRFINTCLFNQKKKQLQERRIHKNILFELVLLSCHEPNFEITTQVSLASQHLNELKK